MSWIDSQIPASIGKYKITSECDGEYNCIGWAATSSKTEWWQYGPGYKWPAKNRSPLIESLVDLFLTLGYEQRERTDSTLEVGYEKIALYSRNGFWKHAARQLPIAKWSSKLGPDEDIEHDDPYCLEGTSYGTVHCIMRRKMHD